MKPPKREFALSSFDGFFFYGDVSLITAGIGLDNDLSPEWSSVYFLCSLFGLELIEFPSGSWASGSNSGSGSGTSMLFS